MAGKNGRFDGRAFRRNLQFVMNMGAPTDAADQATFLFPNQLVYNAGQSEDADANGVPFDPAIPVTRVTPPTVKVPCAVEYRSADGIVTDFGMIGASRAVLTLLDEDYAKVKGCHAVLLAGQKFVFQKTEFPSALFDVGLYVMHFQAEDDV